MSTVKVLFKKKYVKNVADYISLLRTLQAKPYKSAQNAFSKIRVINRTMTVSSDLIERIFDWGKNCTKNCKTKLKALIAEWPTGEKPSQLVSPGSMVGEGKLGTVVARSGNNITYDLLVNVHNADSIGREIDPEKKWGKLFNMGGIPGIGIGARLTRGLSNTGSAVGSGVASGLKGSAFVAMCLSTAGYGHGCRERGLHGSWIGGKKTRKRKNKKNKNKKSRRKH